MFVKKNFDTDFYGRINIHDARIHSINLIGKTLVMTVSLWNSNGNPYPKKSKLTFNDVCENSVFCAYAEGKYILDLFDAEPDNPEYIAVQLTLNDMSNLMIKCGSVEFAEVD